MSATISSKPTIARDVQARLEGRGCKLKVQEHAKDLGVSTAAGARSSTQVQSQRLHRATARVERIQTLNSADSRAGRLFNKGAYPPMGRKQRDWSHPLLSS